MGVDQAVILGNKGAACLGAGVDQGKMPDAAAQTGGKIRRIFADTPKLGGAGIGAAVGQPSAPEN